MNNLPIIIASVGVIIFIALIIVIAKGYIKAPPDTAIIISGPRKEPRFKIGTSGFCIPFLERYDTLPLKLIKIDVKSSSAIPTADWINVDIDANVNFSISKDPRYIQLAAQHFLNKNISDIGNIVREVLEGNMREIVGKMKLTDMVSDRKAFSKEVESNVIPDFQAMGLDLVSFNVQEISDHDDVIVNLGIDNIVAIQKSAAIAKANNLKEIAIAEAEADKIANDAKVASATAIAEKNNELDIKKAELKKSADKQKAIADAAYQIEQQQQLKQINIASAEAESAKQEKLIEVREREVSVREKELEANITKAAEAEKKAQIVKSEAELYKIQKDSEAELYQQQKTAEAIEKIAEANKKKALAEADATKYAALADAEAVKAKGLADAAIKQANGIAEAETTKANGLAEAEAIKMKGLAEAEGVKAKGLADAEAIDKKADAMAKYGDAARQEMQLQALEKFFEQFPEVAKAIAAPLAKVGNITMYGEGNTAKLTGEVTKTLTQVFAGLKDSTGIDPTIVLSSLFGSKLAGIGHEVKD